MTNLVLNRLIRIGRDYFLEKKSLNFQHVLLSKFNASKPVYIEFWGIDTDTYKERRQIKTEIYNKYPELFLIELEDKDLDDLDRVLSSKLTEVGINVAFT